MLPRTTVQGRAVELAIQGDRACRRRKAVRCAFETVEHVLVARGAHVEHGPGYVAPRGLTATRAPKRCRAVKLAVHADQAVRALAVGWFSETVQQLVAVAGERLRRNGFGHNDLRRDRHRR